MHPKKKIENTAFRVPQPALVHLQARLEEAGIHADSVRVASVFLEIIRERMPGKDPERFLEWAQQLAIDILQDRKRSPRLTPAWSRCRRR